MVTIETKFMTVGDNWIQEIGVDFRGIGDNPLSDVTNGLEDMASRGLDNGGTGSAGSNAAGAPSSGFYYDDEADGDFRGRTENYFGSDLGETLSTMGGMTFQYSCSTTWSSPPSCEPSRRVRTWSSSTTKCSPCTTRSALT